MILSAPVIVKYVEENLDTSNPVITNKIFFSPLALCYIEVLCFQWVGDINTNSYSYNTPYMCF